MSNRRLDEPERATLRRRRYLGTSVHDIDADAESGETLRAVKQFAESRGLSLNDFLRPGGLKSDTEYPGPNCFTPLEVECLVTNQDLDDSRLAHLDECPSCGAVVAAAVPDTELLLAFLEETRAHLSRALQNESASPLSSTESKKAVEEKALRDYITAASMFTGSRS